MSQEGDKFQNIRDSMNDAIDDLNLSKKQKNGIAAGLGALALSFILDPLDVVVGVAIGLLGYKLTNDKERKD
jgi:hypothetical protein